MQRILTVAPFPVSTHAPLIVDAHKGGITLVNKPEVTGRSLITYLSAQAFKPASLRPLVLADMAAFYRLLEAAQGSVLARKLMLGTCFAGSGVVVILSQALEAAYGISGGLDVARKALNIAGTTRAQVLENAYNLAKEGVRRPYDALDLLSRQAWVTRSTDTHQQFAGAETVHAMWNMIASSDPLGRTKAKVDGSVFSGEIVKVWAGKVEVLIRPPFRARAGKKLTTLLPDMSLTTPVEQVSVTSVTANEGGTFTMEGRLVGNTRLQEGQSHEFIETPFIPHSSKVEGRWDTLKGLHTVCARDGELEMLT